MSLISLMLAQIGATATHAATPSAPTPVDSASITRKVTTSSSDSFIDSVGINAHWSYTDTPYSYAYQEVRAALVRSGIRHVRGEASRATDLFAAGIETTVLVDLDVTGRGDPSSTVKALEPLVADGAVVAVEGPNEPDLFWRKRGSSYKGRQFPEGALLWQRDLFDAAKALDGGTLPVIGPTLGDTYWGRKSPFPDGSLRTISDYGNFHPYPSGNPFTQTVPYAGARDYWRFSDHPSVALDPHGIEFDTYRPAFGDRPMMATETGYSTWRDGQSEEVQAKYTPRLLLENYRLGIQRTYLYEFVDEFSDPAHTNREANFGLLRHDLSPKPAYTALQSLLSVAQGPATTGGTAAAPAIGRTFSITARAPTGYSSADLRSLALARPDGSTVIAMWQEVSASDRSGLSETPRRGVRQLSHPPVHVSVDVGGGSGVSAQVIGADGALEAVPISISGGSATLQVPDRVTLLTVPPQHKNVTRLAGEDRIATALAVAIGRSDLQEGADSVVIASADGFADALAAAPAARALTAPLLLTSPARLDSRVRRYLAGQVRRGSVVYIAGGPDAVGRRVEEDLRRAGYAVKRVGGADRYETAVALSDLMDSLAGRRGCDFALATGRDFADGVAAAGIASPHRPILFTNGPLLPEVTESRLSECTSASLWLIGGPAAVAGQSVRSPAEKTVAAGTDRFSTAAALVRLIRSSNDQATDVVIASGEDFPDALVGGTLGHPVLLTRREDLPSATGDLLAVRGGALEAALVVGGPAAVSPDVVDALSLVLSRQKV